MYILFPLVHFYIPYQSVLYWAFFLLPSTSPASVLSAGHGLGELLSGGGLPSSVPCSFSSSPTHCKEGGAHCVEAELPAPYLWHHQDLVCIRGL